MAKINLRTERRQARIGRDGKVYEGKTVGIRKGLKQQRKENNKKNGKK